MEEILTISELTRSIKNHLESRFALVCAQGEISNFKEQSSGHLYFTLKDAESQISAVFFKGSTKGLLRMPKVGDQVIVKGELSVYAPRGNYQIIIRELTFAGVGELLLKLHELKLKIAERGWFSKDLKKPLPKFPKTIGVVTSPTGSVIQDILHVLKRRFSGFHLILNPVRVQGEGAALEIAQAIEHFNRHVPVDVLIVGRGGGSLEDLWPFNEEIVAAAIFASKIPVISAVGHETDHCIADYVADVRAPTPSAAAEMAMGEKAHHIQFLTQTRTRLVQTLKARVSHMRSRLERFSKHPLLASPYALLGKYSQQLDDARATSDNFIKKLLQQKKILISGRQRELLALKPTTQIANWRKELHRIAAHLKSIDPKNLLTKGYCILFQEESQSVILEAQAVKADDKISILMHDGKIKAHVTEVDV